MPDWQARVRERLTGLDLDAATEAETIEELTQHVEDRYRDLLAEGHTEDAAATQAWRELEGHPRLAREIASVRLRRASPPLQDTGRNALGAWLDDIGFAWRRLCHSPGFAFVALLTVTLTVGANTAILSVADAVLFRPLPFANPDDVAIIQMRDRKSGQQSTLTPYAYLSAIDEACPSVSAVGLFEPVEWPGSTPRPTFDTSEGLVNVDTWEATSNYFELLGVRAARGRLFNEGDRGRERLAAVLSHSAWLRFYGGDESVVGRTIPLGAISVDLIGVLPAGFVFPSAFAGRPAMVVLRKPLGPGDSGGTFHPIVRISRGVSWERAQAEIEAATAGVVVSPGENAENAGVPVLREVRELLYPVGRSVMSFLLAAALFILILGCANLANMMVVRGRRGLHDTAVRVALGASRLRLIRPMVLEALMLGLGGAVLAIVLTKLTFASLLRQVPPVAYGRADVGIDGRVALFALLMGVLCSFAFSIVPAWRASGVDALRLIQRRGGRGSQVRLGRPLIAVQVAIAAAVIFGAVASARAFVTVLSVSVGFSADRVAQISLGAPAVLSPAERRLALDRVLQALARRPDIESVGAAGSIPFSGRAPDSGVRAVPGGPLLVGVIYALPGYLETIGLSPIRGRLFVRDDVQGNPEAVVMSLGGARALFGDRDPVGEVFDDGRGRRFHVIGVVGNVRNFVDRDTAPLAYAIPPPGRGALTIVAKIRNPTGSTLADIKADIRWLFPIGLTTVTWWEDSISSNTAYQNPRFQTIVLSGLAALALGLTGLGIFSVVAYVVAARAREMGVRLAIGASPRSLVWMIVGQSLVPVGVGLGGGFLLILWGRKLAEAQLFDIHASDPAALVASAVAVAAAALGASYLPARRATRISPTEVLRAE